MPNDELGERTLRVLHGAVDPDDCETMVTREVEVPKEPTPERKLERRIKTIARVIDALKK